MDATRAQAEREWALNISDLYKAQELESKAMRKLCKMLDWDNYCAALAELTSHRSAAKLPGGNMKLVCMNCTFLH